MSKLVGIISYGTYSDHMNYGAYLHAYAFQKVLEQYGVDSVIIDYRAKSLSYHSLKYPILNYWNIFDFRRFLFRFFNYTIGFFPNLRKYKKIQNFVKKNEKTTARQYTHKELQRIAWIEDLNFDTFVCESDVIWKLWSSNDEFDKGFFLSFPAAMGKKKVAYAPSLSSKPFTSERENEFANYIKDFFAISTREAQGAEYVSSLVGGRKVDWVLDPTLLLSKSDYEKIAKEPKERNYVLLYTCMKDDQKMVREAEAFAKERGMELIEISNYSINKILNHHKVKDDLGIEEWLGYFMNANYIICNAFHGFCFSVIFRKEVFLFLRTKNDFRMQNITNALGLQERLITCENLNLTDKSPINYDSVYEKLGKIKERSLKFIIDNIIS